MHFIKVTSMAHNSRGEMKAGDEFLLNMERVVSLHPVMRHRAGEASTLVGTSVVTESGRHYTIIQSPAELLAAC